MSPNVVALRRDPDLATTGEAAKGHDLRESCFSLAEMNSEKSGLGVMFGGGQGNFWIFRG